MEYSAVKSDPDSIKKSQGKKLFLGITVEKKVKHHKSVKQIISKVFSIMSSMAMLIALVLILFKLFEIAFWSSIIALAFLLLRLPLIPFGPHFRSMLIYGAINIALSFLLYSLMISASI